MATRSQILSPESITDLTAALALAEGQSYLIQALTSSRIFLAELSAAPSEPGGPGHVMLPYETGRITQSGDRFYGWGDGAVVVTEA